MLKVHTLALGAYQTNCYIVHDSDSKTCAVIDPGYEPEKILAFLKERDLSLEAILLTHGHFDHVGAVQTLAEQTGCVLWMSQGDYSQPISPVSTYFYPIANCDFTEIQFCEEGQVIEVAGLKLAVLETPGHTWGSVCYRCEDALFSGDTLFAGSCGRTDLPGGDHNTIGKSLQRLARIPEDLKVFPGHGESTNLSREKKYNPYMR